MAVSRVCALLELARAHLDHRIYRRCETDQDRESCLEALSTYLDEMNDPAKQSNVAEIETSFSWLTTIIRDPTTSAETLEAVYSVYSHVIPYAQFNPPFLRIVLRKFHDQNLYDDMVKIWQREAETGRGNLVLQIDLILKVATDDESSYFLNEDNQPTAMDKQNLRKRRQRFAHTVGAVDELRRRMELLLDETEPYEERTFEIISNFEPEYWPIFFRDGDDELLWNIIR